MKKAAAAECILFFVIVLALAFVLPLGKVSAAAPPELVVTCDGSEASSLFLHEDDKKILTAKGMPDETTYSWQLLIPDTLIWTDIYGLNSSECVATRALIEGSYNKDGKAVLRCAAMLNGEAYFSDPVVIAPELTVPEKAPLRVSTMSRPAPIMRAPVADETREYVTITIKYLLNDAQGTVIHDSYVANLRYGASFNAVVPSPEYIGYSPYRLVGEPGTETEERAETVELNYSELREDVVITVYYKPAESRYMVRYFFQNISDDGYTEDTTKSFTSYAVTGEYPKENVEKSFEGFSTLFHEPDTVAADGSTEFNVYYDRNYYLYQFDCDGGYGTEPVYARYGTPLVVPAPTKPGYEFDKWIYVPEEGEPTPEDTSLPTSILAGNRTYKALWKNTLTSYTVVYYLENPDDDEYSYWSSKDVSNVSTGTVLTLDNISLEKPENEENLDQFLFDEVKTREEWPETGIIVDGDGNTIVNLYFKRRTYTLEFIYAREDTTTTIYYRGNKETERNVVNTYYVPGGSTYYFGDDPNRSVEAALAMAGDWGQVEEPKLNAEFIDTNSIETSRKYHSTISNESSNSTQTIVERSYLCFSVTRKYGALLDDIWPTTMRFYPTKRIKASDNGSYAVFSAWNGEGRVAYTRKNQNQTIKGRYLRLDNELLFFNGLKERDKNGNFTYDYSNAYEDDNNRTVTFLAFWENGSAGWARARKWNYEIYVEPLPMERTEFETKYPEKLETLKKNALNGELGEVGEFTGDNGNYYDEEIGQDEKGNPVYRRWVWYNGYDQYKMDGNSLYTRGTEGLYYLFDSYICTDDNTAKNFNSNSQLGFYQQTPPGGLGFEIKCGQYKDSTIPQNDTMVVGKDQNGKDIIDSVQNVFYSGAVNVDPNTQHNARFFFDRSTYFLKFFNSGEQLSQDNVGFKIRSGRPLSVAANAIVHYGLRNIDQITLFPKIDDVTVEAYPDNYADWLAPKYPSNLESGAYYFNGWYRSPQFLQGTELNNTDVMPARNASLYAQWIPVSHTVTFSASYDAMVKGEYIDVSSDSKILTIPHRQRIYTANIPNTDEWKDVIGGSTTYNFVGWFYIDTNGVKHSFDPTKMTVDNDMHLYAEWSSSDIVQYTVHYVKQDGGETIADDFTGYTYAGTTKTFNAKAGDELFDRCRQGWYPTVSSHSIIVSDANKEFTFEYVYKEKVNYTVRYLEKGTDAVLKEEKTETTKNAVITEKFAPIDGYIPDAFYKILVLSADDGQNIITFYYTKNDKDALCVIEHYTESLTEGKYTLHSRNEVSGVIDQPQTAPVLSIKGFTYNETVTRNSNDADVTVTKDGVSGKITKEGIVLKLYYTRNSYPYKVVYVNSEDINAVLKTPVPNGSGKYGSTVTYQDDPDVLYFDNIRYKREEISSEKSLVITDDNEQQIVFHYRPDRVDITYIPASRYSTIGGTLDRFIDQNIYKVDQIKGSTPTVQNGYRFVGWYYDAQFEHPVENDWVNESNKSLIPLKLYYKGDAGVQPYQDNTYYALFEPVVGDLVIKKEVASPENCKDTFLFNVKGTSGTAGAGIDLTVSIIGSGSVTVTDLPVGAYTVIELNGWSWKYDSDGATTQTAEVSDSAGNTATVTFTNSQNSKKWLGGESSNENKFEQNTETSD